MKGLLVVLALAVATALALLAPVLAVAALLAAALLGLRRGRPAFVAFATIAILIDALIVGATLQGAPVSGLPFLSVDGLARGAVAGMRLAAAMGANLALLSWVPPARVLDDLKLPRRVTALLAAVLLAAHDIGREFARLKRARILKGAWPKGRVARIRAAARLIPLLIIASEERSMTRRDALRLAGIRVGRLFVPIVAIAALAAAGRLAFLALPNVALTYVLVFLGGMLMGPLAAALGGALGMALTDFMLTGLYLPGFVNAPAMMLLGAAGGLFRRVDLVGRTRADRLAGLFLLASVGIVATFAFSALTDVMTWALVLRDEADTLRPLLVAGLAFNVIPALVNGALFATAVGPASAAYAAHRGRTLVVYEPHVSDDAAEPTPP